MSKQLCDCCKREAVHNVVVKCGHKIWLCSSCYTIDPEDECSACQEEYDGTLESIKPVKNRKMKKEEGY